MECKVTENITLDAKIQILQLQQWKRAFVSKRRVLLDDEDNKSKML